MVGTVLEVNVLRMGDANRSQSVQIVERENSVACNSFTLHVLSTQCVPGGSQCRGCLGGERRPGKALPRTSKLRSEG